MKAFYKILQLAEASQKARMLDEFFSLILTPQEQEQVLMRYALIEALIKDELPQREISTKLGVSIAKITRGSNALKQIDPKLLGVVRRFFKK